MTNEEVRLKFINKFRADKRKFGDKLKSIGLARATWGDIRYNRRIFKKKTIEAMRAYLENRPTKYDLIKSSDTFYCCTCETAMPIEKRSGLDRWTCRRCRNKQKRDSKKRNMETYLAKNRRYKLRKKYGPFGPSMRIILDLKKELKNEIK